MLSIAVLFCFALFLLFGFFFFVVVVVFFSVVFFFVVFCCFFVLFVLFVFLSVCSRVNTFLKFYKYGKQLQCPYINGSYDNQMRVKHIEIYKQ